MFSTRYFPSRYFSGRYWPKVGSDEALNPIGVLRLERVRVSYSRPELVGVAFSGLGLVGVAYSRPELTGIVPHE